MNQRVFFEWSDDMSVGVAELDAQHLQLITLLNRLFVSVVERDKDKITIEILDALIDYTKEHFALEEQLMQEAGFDADEFAAHKEAHQEFVDKVGSAAHKNLVEGKSVSFELIHYLKNWLRDHILISDMRYRDFLIGRKVSLQSPTSGAKHKARPDGEEQAKAKPWWKVW